MPKKIMIFVEENFEDLEVMYPKIMLTGEGFDVTLAGGGAKTYHGKYGYPVKPNGNFGDYHPKDFDAVILPGGKAPDKLRLSKEVLDFVKSMEEDKKVVAAICHGPWVLQDAGVLKGKKSTSTPSIRDDIIKAGSDWEDSEVVVDGNLITSRNPNDLPAFCREIVKALK